MAIIWVFGRFHRKPKASKKLQKRSMRIISRAVAFLLLLSVVAFPTATASAATVNVGLNAGATVRLGGSAQRAAGVQANVFGRRVNATSNLNASVFGNPSADASAVVNAAATTRQVDANAIVVLRLQNAINAAKASANAQVTLNTDLLNELNSATAAQLNLNTVLSAANQAAAKEKLAVNVVPNGTSNLSLCLLAALNTNLGACDASDRSDATNPENPSSSPNPSNSPNPSDGGEGLSILPAETPVVPANPLAGGGTLASSPGNDSGAGSSSQNTSSSSSSSSQSTSTQSSSANQASQANQSNQSTQSSQSGSASNGETNPNVAPFGSGGAVGTGTFSCLGDVGPNNLITLVSDTAVSAAVNPSSADGIVLAKLSDHTCLVLLDLLRAELTAGTHGTLLAAPATIDSTMSAVGGTAVLQVSSPKLETTLDSVGTLDAKAGL
jgi:hypothetical protein